MQKTILVAFSLLLVGPGRVAADYIASNGPINGFKNAIGIDPSSAIVSDSFALNSAAEVTGVEVALWSLAGSTPVSFEWSLGTIPFGTDVGSGTAHPTNTFRNFTQLSNKYSIFVSAFPVSAKLQPGEYWLTLKNGRSSNSSFGAGLSWDINFGPSSSFITYPNDDRHGKLVSHSFFIIGNEADETIASPEPSSVIMFLAGTLILTGFLCRRRLVGRLCPV